MSNYNSLSEIFRYAQDTSPDPMEEYIRSFSELPEAWNFGEGRAPSAEIIEKAIQIYRLGRSFGLIVNAFPVGEGEIEISFSYRDHFIDILITGQNNFEYTYEVGIGDEYDEIEYMENLSLEDVKSKLRVLEELNSCNSLEYFQQEGFIGVRADSKAVISQEGVQGSPSLIEIVCSRIMAPQYAAT